MKIWKSAFRASVPVLFGYVPLGAAFGVLFSSLGLPWYFSTLSGLIVFAGSAQFLSVSLLASRLGFLEIFLATFTLNIRHLFYGFSFLKRYQGAPWKPYLVFGLTDETYSLLSARVEANQKEDQKFCLALTLINQCYWVFGCSIGAIFAGMFTIQTKGFEFILTALFVVLAVEQWFAVRNYWPFIVGIIASLAALFVFPAHFLLAAVGFATIGFLFFSIGGRKDG